jgi:hypothetical protein
MSQFKISSRVDKNKVFLVNHSELEGRLDIDFYRPNIMALEKIIRQKSTKKLNDYIVCMKSGATPSVTEEEQFYSDAENGIPFLRVQNLSTSGEINLEGVRYINEETHEKYLKRSQVFEGNLLVKITGVGRMAIASVAPESFIGNTNQHMVVIKTTSNEQSRYLANYLNLDIAEALATRRTTGGTRPALDYPALRSIPIVEGIDFSVLKQAEQIRKQKEQQAQALLAEIDAYLLTELSINLPTQNNSLEQRIFTSTFNQVVSNRLDANFHHKFNVLFSKPGKYKYEFLKNLLTQSPQYGANEEACEPKSDNDVRYIRITDIDEYGNLKHGDWKTTVNVNGKYHLHMDDILFARSGSVGRCYIHKDSDQEAIFAGYLIKFQVDKTKINPNYLFYYCHSAIYKFWVSAIQRPSVQANINAEEYKALLIPLPPIDKQNEIAEYIANVRNQAKQLQTEAAQILADAKAEVERMILGE